MDLQDVIDQHLELRRRNARLDESLPLDRYRAELAAADPAPAPPEGLLEETEELARGWLPVSEPRTGRRVRDESPQLWQIPPLFDWGD
jgi:hypothetical protein